MAAVRAVVTSLRQQCEDMSVNDRAKRWAIAGLFIFLYIPFLYQHGYQKISIRHGDFPTIYWAAKLAFVEHRSPYVNGAFAEGESQLNQHLFPYLYPPTSLLLFYPFSLVSYDGAKLELLIASHVCILIFIYLFFFKTAERVARPPSGGLVTALSSVYVLSYYPIVDNLAWGQINLIVLALVCLAWYGLKRKGHALSIALPLSVAILLKTYPVLLLPLMLVKKRYHATAAVVALLLLYALVAWSVLPGSLWRDWFVNVLPSGGYGLVPFNLFLPVEPWNHSINGFGTFLQSRLARILWMPSHMLTRPLSYMLSASVMAVTIGLSYLCARRGREALELEVSSFLLMMFLVAPLSWEHHLVYALPAALTAIYLLLYENTHRVMLLLVVASLFILAWDFPRDEMYLLKGVWAAVNPIKFFAVFTIWLFFALKLWERVRNDIPSGSVTGAT
jgi:hypothetical protein